MRQAGPHVAGRSCEGGVCPTATGHFGRDHPAAQREVEARASLGDAGIVGDAPGLGLWDLLLHCLDDSGAWAFFAAAQL